MDKQILAHPYNGKLLSNNKEQNDTFNNMDESRKQIMLSGKIRTQKALKKDKTMKKQNHGNSNQWFPGTKVRSGD